MFDINLDLFIPSAIMTGVFIYFILKYKKED